MLCYMPDQLQTRIEEFVSEKNLLDSSSSSSISSSKPCPDYVGVSYINSVSPFQSILGQENLLDCNIFQFGTVQLIPL